MKKILIMLLLTLFSSEVRAENCPVAPSCEDLGYIYTEDSCAGNKMLKCPLDKSKVFCHKTKESPNYAGKACSVGDIFSINHRKCTTEKNSPSDYIFIETLQKKSSLMAITLHQDPNSLEQGSFDDAKKINSNKNDRLISKAQLQKILRYFLLHYEYRCIITQEGLVYIDETTGNLRDILSKEDFKLCSNEKIAPLGNFYNLKIARLNYKFK